MLKYNTVLTVAGSDPRGGAGMQADLKTMASLGCYGLSVITALTIQNTRGVYGVYPIPPSIIIEQLDALMQDIRVKSVKIGLLPTKDAVISVAESVKKNAFQHVIVDPVFSPTTGTIFADKHAVDAYVTKLLPLSTVITPNFKELAILLNIPEKSVISSNLDELEKLCIRLGEKYQTSVVLKGGDLQNHAKTQLSTDIFYCAEENTVERLSGPRIPTSNTHGTGCSFSSAIASFLTQKKTLQKSVKLAKTYITEAIKYGSLFSLGNSGGMGPIHHFYQFWPKL